MSAAKAIGGEPVAPPSIVDGRINVNPKANPWARQLFTYLRDLAEGEESGEFNELWEDRRVATLFQDDVVQALSNVDERRLLKKFSSASIPPPSSLSPPPPPIWG